MTIDRLTTQGAEEQGSYAWKLARLGNFTATCIADLMSKGRSKDAEWGDKAITCMAEKAGERQLTEQLKSDEEEMNAYFDLQCRENAAMRHGHEWEGMARTRYEFDYLPANYKMEECGLLKHAEVPYLAYSPDGCMVDARGTIRGIIEVKCPSTLKTYMRYRWNIKDADTLKKEKPEYYWQIQTGLSVTGAKWCDFICFCPWIENDMHVVRIERNEEDIEAIEKRVVAANIYIGQMEATNAGSEPENKCRLVQTEMDFNTESHEATSEDKG